MSEAGRFAVTYAIHASDAADASARAEAVALEDTLEIPRDIVPAGYVEDIILGRVEDLTADGPGRFKATVSYHVDTVGAEFPQFLNVLLGNASLFAGVKAVALAPCPDLLSRFPGPAHGAAGLRRLTGRATGGLLAPVVKPMGESAATLAALAGRMAAGGADIVKEDHGLANQPAAPLTERLARTVDAVAEANARRTDGTRALYFASILPHGEQVRDAAFAAQEAGADGILLIPGLLGFGAMQRLAADPDFRLPIMAHPSHLGPYVLSDRAGYSHGMLFGTLMRLAGADITVFPNFGGRFGFTREQCRDIADAASSREGPGRPAMPSPGGGMSLERLNELAALYGPDCAYLLGGSLLREGAGIGTAMTRLRAVLDRA